MRWDNQSALVVAVIGVLALLSGCAQVSKSDSAVAVLATPLQVTFQEEQALGRLAQLLNEPHLQNDERADLLYHRGLLFDRMGLRSLAVLDFREAVRIKPSFYKAYNLLGLYMVQEQEFVDAYDAFDSVLELEPKADYAYLNRGIALYYGKRFGLAKADLEKALAAQPNDPYRWLWWYFVTAEEGQEKHAHLTLAQQYKQHRNEGWGWSLLGVLSGELNHTDALQHLARDAQSNKVLAQHLCEIYFYMGKQAQLQRQQNTALSYFRLSLSNNVQSFLEHRFARLEIERMSASENHVSAQKQEAPKAL